MQKSQFGVPTSNESLLTGNTQTIWHPTDYRYAEVSCPE